MAESKEEFDRRIADAKIAFGKNDERAKIHAAQVQTFSSDAMKAPALVSAAGVAAALGFYSANYDRLSQSPENLQTFNSILFWLFASLLFIVCAPGFAYFSQIAYGAAIYAENYQYEHPFTVETAKSKRLRWVGDLFRWLAVVLVVTSIACLIRGGSLFLRIVA
ncbi:hypothetical protein [Mesorhizobium sp. M0138]|uniref:hypothetical protein n=1 Tax=Mesorhizobium sp. M0138 TaxID=2956891 RepID=UPI00333DD7B0